LAGDKVLHAAGDGQTKGRADRRKGERTDVLTDGRTNIYDEAHNLFGTFVKLCAFVNRENWTKFLKSQNVLD